MKKHFAFLCTIILLVGVVGVANADIIAWEGVFTASNFEVEWGPDLPPPDDPVSGSFSFSIDDSLLNPVGETSLLEQPVSAISLTIDEFSYSTSDVGINLLFMRIPT